MKLTYPGPHDAVEISTLGLIVERGATVEIADEQVANQLIAQGWKKAGRTAKEDDDA